MQLKLSNHFNFSEYLLMSCFNNTESHRQDDHPVPDASISFVTFALCESYFYSLKSLELLKSGPLVRTGMTYPLRGQIPYLS